MSTPVDPPTSSTIAQVLRARWLWTGHALIADGALAVDDAGLIDAVGPLAEVRARVASRVAATVASAGRARPPIPEHDLGDALLMPGLVNAHSHAFQRVFRGHVQWQPAAAAGEVSRGDFWSWREAMYRAANSLDADAVEAVSLRCFREMVAAGITHVGEFHYLHHDVDGQPYADPDELARRVIAAARAAGLRITLLRVVYGAGGVGRPLLPEQRRFATRSPDEALAAVARLATLDDPAVTVGLAPHSVRAVPRDWLPELGSFGGVIHAHVAEQPAEVAACKAAWGRAPLAVFAEAGLLHERFTAVHLTWPAAEDPGLLARSGARVCVCPSTELDLGDGFLPLAVREQAALCLGSDSHARIDLFAEARSLELHARALAGRRNVLSPPVPTGSTERYGLAARLLRAATVEGSAALLGRDPRELGLQPGEPADCCAIGLDRLAAEGVPPLEAAVFVASPAWVIGTWVAGVRVG